MGTIVGAALVSHHPGLFRPKADRLALGNGKDSDLIPGYERVRSRIDAATPDTLIIFDTHWFTTQRHLVAGAARYQGSYTSGELPWILSDIAYDYPGAPELAAKIQKIGDASGVACYNATEPGLDPEYGTVNLLGPLWRGEKVLRVGICQNARPHHFLEMGEVIRKAIDQTEGRFMLIASGAMSHRMVDMDFIPKNPNVWHMDNISNPEFMKLDFEILELWTKGDHASVIERYPELRAASYEGFGGHYMQMVGALGGKTCTAKAERLSDYEVAMGTANLHVWFSVNEQKRVGQ